MSLVYLNGDCTLKRPGISSYHLKGSMCAQVRRWRTGFIELINRPIKDEKLNTVLDWLIENNPLYSSVNDLNELCDMDEFTLKIARLSKTKRFYKDGGGLLTRVRFRLKRIKMIIYIFCAWRSQKTNQYEFL